MTGRGARPAIIAGAAILVLAAGAVAASAVTAPRGAPSSSASTTSSPHARAGDAGRIQDPVPPSATAPSGVPVRVDVPAIGASSDLENLHTDANGKLVPPARPGTAGWFGAGIVPGSVGPAIIAGHIDYAAGPGIFENLGRLRVGDTARVTMSTGAVLTFRVYGSEESAKAQFPTAAVYGTTPDPQLRLITCAGTVDPSTRLYRDNLVVFLALVR